MSGHSKWAKIKRDKASNDARRGALFTKLGNQIAIAARAGTDPETNPSLAMVIETAKAANMPLSTIDRAIKRVADKAAAVFEEILYEGYGQGGVAILVACATDNRRRTYPEVKSAFAKAGGQIASAGSVSHQFDHVGRILADGSGDEALMVCLEAGGIDAEVVDDRIAVTTNPTDLHRVREEIKAAGLSISQAELGYQPKTEVQPDPETAAKVAKLLDQLDSLADVVNVYSNLVDDSA